MKSTLIKFRRLRRKLFVVLLLFVLALGSYQIWAYFSPRESEAAWWDEGWLYRKQINFGNSGGSQTNKIVSFSQNTATPIAEGKMQAGCQDIRFVDNTGRPLEHRVGYRPEIQYVPGSVSEYSSQTNQSSYSFSHTVAAGQDRALVVTVHAMNEQTGSNPINVNSVTFNGTAMTKQTEVDLDHPTSNNRNYATAIFTLVNPTVTTANVVVTLNGTTGEHVASAMNFIGVDQTTPVGITASNTGASLSNVAVTGTTLYNNSVLVGGGSRQSVDTGPVRQVYAQIPGKHVYSAATGGGTSRLGGGGGFQYAETPGSHTMTFGLSNATSDTHMAGAFIELKQAAGCNSTVTNIEVLMPNIDSGESAVYMYYGNSSAIAATSLLTDSSKTLAYKEVSSDSNGNDSQFSSHSYSHTVTAGNNQTLVVVVDQIRHQSGDVPVDVASVTYNSKPMVRQVFADGTSTNRNGSTEVWTLLNPDVGNNQVAITLSKTSTVIVSAAMTFENTRQNYFPAAGAAFEPSSTSFNINIATTKPNTLLAGGGARHRSTTAPNATTATVNVTSPGTRVYHVLQANPAIASSISSAGGHQPALSAGVNTMNLTTTTGGNQFMTGALIALEPESSYDAFSPTSGPTAGNEENGPGPVGYWKFDEGSGANAFDSTPTQNHGTVSGAAWQTAGSCIFGPCLFFDGSNDVVTVTNNDSLDFDTGLKTGVSVSFWVNPSSDGEGDNGRIFTKGSHLWCRTDSQSGGTVDLECTIDLATTDATVNIAGGLTIGAWHHVEITYGDDGDDDLLVYINGELKGTGNGSGAPVGTDSSNFLIGGDTSTNYHGYLDDFKIFVYERTADQVKTDYLKGASAAGSNIAVGIGGTAMPDPIAWWRLDEMNGTTANDSTSSGLSGTITGATWTREGKYSSALSFDGDDYVAVADTATLDITGDFTLSVWVNRVAGGSGTRDVIAKYNASSPNGGYKLGVGNQGEVYCGTANGTSYVESYTDTGMVTDTSGWVHLAAVRSGTGCRVYVNGLDMTTTFATHTTLTANAEALRIGSSSNGVQYWHGSIDDVKIYDVALTADQVKTDHNATSAFNAGTGVNERALHASGDSYLSSLYAHWSFDENTGTGSDFAKDSSGNERHANTSGGTAIWTPGVYGSGVDFNNAWRINGGSSNFNPGLSDFTYMAWVYLDSREQIGRYLFHKITVDAYGYSTRWNASTNIINSGLRYGYSPMQTSVSISNYLDSWNHYAFVYDRDDLLSVYINGQLVDTGSITSYSAISITNGQNFSIATEGGNNMYAKMDEFKFFMSALTPAQIAYEYNRGAPLAWYRMDECQGATINDASGNGFNGTLTIGGSGTYTAAGTCGSGTGTHSWNAGTTGKFSSAIALDGTNDYTSVADNAALRFDSGTQDFSLFAWVKRNASGAAHYIISKEDANNDGYRLLLTSSNTLMCSVDTIDVTSSSTITDTNWHHVGCVIDRDGNGRVYIDGQPDGSPVAISSEAMATTTAMTLGRRSYATSYFNGLVDDVRIYNYALSATQVKSVMTGGAVRFE